MNTKSKKRSNFRRPPQAKREPKKGAFRMVVAANPGSSFDIAPELELVKAALLYGDKVTLLSPVTTMLLRAEALQRFTPPKMIELVRRCAPILGEGGEDFQAGLGEVEDLLRSSTGGGLASGLLRAGLLQQFRGIQRELTDVVSQMRDEAGLDALDVARAQGLVVCESADPGDDMDLLVSCVTAAKLARTGERLDNPHTDRIVATFVELLRRHLAGGREYLVFDPAIASLTEAAIREGVFKPAAGPAGRSAQAMAAADLMGYLPTFPDSTVDEVLDIRQELISPLTQFRGAMVDVASSFTSQPWDSDFDDEVHNAWVGTIEPALSAIQATVSDDRSLLARASGVAGQLKSNWPALALVGAGLVGHKPVLDALGGTAAIGSSLLEELRTHQVAQSEIRMRPFYFLYAVDQSLV